MRRQRTGWIELLALVVAVAAASLIFASLAGAQEPAEYRVEFFDADDAVVRVWTFPASAAICVGQALRPIPEVNIDPDRIAWEQDGDVCRISGPEVLDVVVTLPAGQAGYYIVIEALNAGGGNKGASVNTFSRSDPPVVAPSAPTNVRIIRRVNP